MKVSYFCLTAEPDVALLTRPGPQIPLGSYTLSSWAVRVIDQDENPGPP